MQTDVSDLASQDAFPRIPWRRAPLVLLFCIAAVVAFTWPWLSSPGCEVLDHWDPPFHAWKLEFAARQILSGHLLPPHGDTNMYYPYSGAFYFEALHWPQALFAAPLLACGLNAVWTYHVTMAFFWALSGLCFWAFMRALGRSGAASLLGALFFTAMPYRLSYVVEFNMQLCFGVVLLLFFLLRFTQCPSIGYAVGAAIALWLQATSELYQAVFAMFAMPFIACAFFACHPRALRSWREFWLPALVAAAVALPIAAIWLWPYATMLDGHALFRDIKEISKHIVEPLAYLHSSSVPRLIPNIPAHRDEMSVYPTLALLLGAAGHLALRRWRSDDPAWRRIETAFLALSSTVAAIFVATMICVRTGLLPGTAIAIESQAIVVMVALSFAPILFRQRAAGERMMDALGAAAIFGFAMSLGPDIIDGVVMAKAPNALFRFLHGHIPALAGFRVVSRFSLFPMIFLCAAAASFADDARKRFPALPRAFAACALAALFAIEAAAYGRPGLYSCKRPIRDVSQSAAIRALDTLDSDGKPYVLAILPIGSRDLTSEHMLQIAGTKRLSVYAWGGTYPIFTARMEDADFQARYYDAPSYMAGLLRQLWPEALILIDKRPFHGMPLPEYGPSVDGFFTPVAEDDDFRLMRLSADSEGSSEHFRLVRSDLAAANPFASFTLSTKPGTSDTVWLDVNGVIVGKFDVDSVPRRFCITTPRATRTPPLEPYRFRFRSSGDTQFSLAGFTLAADSDNSVSALPDNSRPLGDTCLPWIGYVESSHLTQMGHEVSFPRGITLCGAEMLGYDTEGRIVTMRYYLRVPCSLKTLVSTCLSTGITLDGKIIYEDKPRISSLVDRVAVEFGRTDGIQVIDRAFHLPAHCRPGVEYGISLTLRDCEGRLLAGREADTGRRVRHIPLPAKFTP